jgi:outer membrane protein
MSYTKLLISIFILTFFYNINVYSYDKVAFIDIDYLIKNSTIGQNSLTKIEKLNSKNIEILKEREKILKNLDNEIKIKQNIISEDEYNKEVNLLKNKIKEFNIEKNKMVNEFNTFKENELDFLFKKINPIIQNYMNKNSIEILLDRKNLFIGSISSDLTKIIINEINNYTK